MRWLIAALASVALAIFCLSVCLTEASANRMNGKGNCTGGICTGGGSFWSSSSNRPPKKK
jgi:hypothetical protein